MTVRVVLRLSDFPAEVVFSFDVDCACVDDGTSVWALHRAPQTGVNIILNPLHAWPNRPTYESRFVKYARCGFAVAALALSSWMSTGTQLIRRGWVSNRHCTPAQAVSGLKTSMIHVDQISMQIR